MNYIGGVAVQRNDELMSNDPTEALAVAFDAADEQLQSLEWDRESAEDDLKATVQEVADQTTALENAVAAEEAAKRRVDAAYNAFIRAWEEAPEGSDTSFMSPVSQYCDAKGYD